MISKKIQLTSIDLFFLAKELNRELNSARIDKIYQISERILRIKIHIPTKGSKDLIIAPNYLCITRYGRTSPEQPSSFAMQLRKHLSGGIIRNIQQHNFDRILEFEIENKDSKFIFIAEFFSNGNIILCDENRRTIGLLEWQKWKDRKLGVGQIYQYPPEGENPLLMDYTKFKEILKCGREALPLGHVSERSSATSDKKLIASLVSDAGVTKLYAEELCLLSDVDKEKKSINLKENEIEILFNHFKKLMEKIKNEKSDPAIILDENNNPVDVVPFDLGIYRNSREKKFDSFNDAIDEYSSSAEFDKFREEAEKKFSAKLEKLKKIELQQSKNIKELGEKADEFRKIGDFIYQNISTIEEIAGLIRKERESGKGWDEIKKNLISSRISGIVIKDIKEKEGLVVLED